MNASAVPARPAGQSTVANPLRRWRRFWLRRGGCSRAGRLASRLAALGAGRDRQLLALAALTGRGFVSPAAAVIGLKPAFGRHVFVGERSVLARWSGSGSIRLGDAVQIHRDCSLELESGGSIAIGARTALQRGCILFSAVAPITIGAQVQVASYCTFHSYDHGMRADASMYAQPLTSKGPIVIEDDAWLGAGARILSGVTIGRGAVVAAGAVVTRDVPALAIAGGVPARVIGRRPAGPDPAEAALLSASTLSVGTAAET